MIILSWNVRGLNNIPRQKVVHRLIDSRSLDIVFIQENKFTVVGREWVLKVDWVDLNGSRILGR